MSKRKEVAARVERIYANDPQPKNRGSVSSMKSFVESTKDFDICNSLQRFETPEMVKKRNSQFDRIPRR